MGPVGVEPEHHWRTGELPALGGQIHPVGDRRVLGGAHAPDVAGVDVVAHEHLAGFGDDAHHPGGIDLVGLVVAAVFLGLLGHEAHIGTEPMVVGS